MISLADARAALLEYLKKASLPVPTVTLQPGQQSLVNLPIIAYAEKVETQTLAADVGIPATITAVPQYSWSFGDPNPDPTENSWDGPGQPYINGVLPRTSPQSYIQHTYRQKGTYSVTCTVRWEATFVVAGIPGVQTLDPVILISPAANLPVVEARGVLIGNN